MGSLTIAVVAGSVRSAAHTVLVTQEAKFSSALKL